MSIAERVLDCVKAFRKLNIYLTEEGTQTDIERQANSALVAKVNDSFERFQLWSSNLGAHRRDRNSLDQRLWEASHLRDRVLEYLEDLQQGVADASAIINGTRDPWDQLSDSSSEEDDQNDAETVTELEQLVVYISNTIDCLLRISLVIQKPAPHDRFIKSGRFDQSFRQPWDEQHVRDKFPDIPEWLSERLGKANSRRRQFLEYRKAHHERIATLEVLDTTRDTGDAGTEVSSLPTLAKHHQEFWTSTTPEILEADNQSDTGMSETSYAETVVGEHALLVPTMPEAAQGGAVFECPFCFMLIRGIHNRIQWKRHVFADLQPYVCLSRDCLSADETFTRRHKWIRHEIYVHMKTWRCNLGCNESFPLENDMLDHITKVHGLQNHMDTHLQALSIQNPHEESTQLFCPLCHDTFNSLRRYHKHVARHLEQLALFVLPRDNTVGRDNDDIEINNDEDEEDQQSTVSVGQDSGEGAFDGSKGQVAETEDAEILADKASLALTYNNNGRYKEAEELQKQVVEARTAVLGEDHPSTLCGKDILTMIYSNQGRHDKAEELKKQVVETKTTVLGEDHPSTLQSISDLALIYRDQRRYNESEELQKQVVERFKTLQGDSHSSTLTNISALARIYLSQERYKEAEELQKQVIEKHKVTLGEDHPDTLNSMSNLAWIYKDQGQYKEAEELQKQVVEKQKAVLGEDDPSTLYSMYALAHTWKLQKRGAEAVELMEQCLQRCEQVLGADHRLYKSCSTCLAEWKEDQADPI